MLVVGAGLSAADAIMAARFRGIPVLHAFRNSTNEWGKEVRINSNYDRLQWLPSSIYPEYHKVYEMMADGGTNYPLYKSLPGYMLVSLDDGDEGINPRRMATLSAPDGQLHTFQVSTAAILIGEFRSFTFVTGFITPDVLHCISQHDKTFYTRSFYHATFIMSDCTHFLYAFGTFDSCTKCFIALAFRCVFPFSSIDTSRLRTLS